MAKKKDTHETGSAAYPPYMDSPRKPSSRVELRLDREHGAAMPRVSVGDDHEMTVKGKVRSVSSDEYGHRVEMDVKPRHVKHHAKERHSLTKAMRNRKMHNGQFA